MGRQILLTLLLFLSAVTVSFADSIVGNFNLDTSLNPVASRGQVTFTLNADGTIAASLVTNYEILAFGVDSVTGFAESGFSPTTPDNEGGWDDPFGNQSSGFLCNACGSSESWTIGTPNEFTSVWQALGGNHSSTDFFLADYFLPEGIGAYGADAQSAVPEPGSLTLLGVGLAGLVLLRRRRA
jgi:hypothetical protein